MAKIEFNDKVSARGSTAAEVQKVTAANMNEIKDSVNALYDGEGGSLILVKRLITSAELLAANTTPINLVPDPVSSTVILLPQAILTKLVYGGSPYTSNTNFQIIYTGTGDFLIQLDLLGGTVDKYGLTNVGTNFTTTTVVEGRGLDFFIPTGNPVGGNSDVELAMWYSEVDLSTIN